MVFLGGHAQVNPELVKHSMSTPHPKKSSGTDKTKTVPNAIVDGWEINLPTPQHALDALIKAASKAESFACLTLNLDHLVKLKSSKAFYRAYKSARFITADGAPVATIARRQSPQTVRTTGADLMLPLCQEAARKNIPIYLFGTSDEVLEKTADQLQKLTHQKLIIAGMVSPPQGFDVNGSEAGDALQKIEQSGARLCFVLLGAPKQELFADRAVKAGIGCGFICVGAAADFIAGHQVRAPHWLQATGMEWLWRLAHNPRRLGLRYLQCALVFARLSSNEVLRSGKRLMNRSL